jgi:hypothetical protein
MGEKNDKGKQGARKIPSKQQLAVTLNTIEQLSTMINLVDYAAYIGRRTKYGDKPLVEPWGHTRKYLSSYSVPVNVEGVIALFEGVGCQNEVQAAEWVVLNDEHVPTQD